MKARPSAQAGRAGIERAHDIRRRSGKGLCRCVKCRCIGVMDGCGWPCCGSAALTALQQERDRGRLVKRERQVKIACKKPEERPRGDETAREMARRIRRCRPAVRAGRSRQRRGPLNKSDWTLADSRRTRSWRPSATLAPSGRRSRCPAAAPSSVQSEGHQVNPVSAQAFLI